MPIFKNTVALEACPAKTAESVSYGVTFAVLGWLLVSNYSGLGNAELAVPTLANTDSTLESTSPPAVFADTDARTETLSTAIVTQRQPNIELEISKLAPIPPTWHTKIEQFPQLEGHSHLRELSTANWSKQSGDANLQIEGFIESLYLPLPLIEADKLFSPMINIDSGVTGRVANNQVSENGLVHEITVTGAETQRLSNRPDSIQRPQIPRPYRAQEIQRSFVLPPRIQALRP